MADLPPQVESVQVLRLQPGDVVVATIPDGTSMASVHDIGEQLRTYFVGHKVIMVTKGLSLEVARPSEEAYQQGWHDGTVETLREQHGVTEAALRIDGQEAP